MLSLLGIPIRLSAFRQSLPPRRRNPDPTDLDRLTASIDHLALCCCEHTVLPKYAPELNDIEVVWHDLKAFNLAHKTFTDGDTLDAAIHNAVADLNTERNCDLLGEQRISA
jgi:hypothetical protein